MQLQKPLTLSSEACYLTHCANIASILANNQDSYAQERIKKYIEITGAELKSSCKQNLCPRCRAEVEFAQNPLRVCDNCGWQGDYTKLEET